MHLIQKLKSLVRKRTVKSSSLDSDFRRPHQVAHRTIKQLFWLFNTSLIDQQAQRIK